MKRIAIIFITSLMLISTGCSIINGLKGQSKTAEELINLTSSMPGLPDGFVSTGHSVGIKNGMNVVAYYSSKDKTKTLMVNSFVSSEAITNPNLEPILALRPEDLVTQAPIIGDTSKLYIQGTMFELIFVKGKIRGMLLGNGLNQPEVVTIGRKFVKALPDNVHIPSSLTKLDSKFDSTLYDRYFQSSEIFVSNQDSKPVDARTCPNNAYVTFSFNAKESIPAWRIQLQDPNKNVVYNETKDSAEKKNTALVIPIPLTTGAYEVFFYINDVLVFDQSVKCGL